MGKSKCFALDKARFYNLLWQEDTLILHFARKDEEQLGEPCQQSLGLSLKENSMK